LQALQIRADVLAGTVALEGVAVVVAGDFNVCSRGTKDDGTLYRTLSSAMAPLRDVYAPGDGADALPTRRPDLKPFSSSKAKAKKGEGALDHAFVAGLAVVKSDVVDLRCADRTVVSDHLGLDLHVALD